MGRNGHGPILSWAEMVMGRNDQLPYLRICVKLGLKIQICKLSSVRLSSFFSETTSVCAYWSMCANQNEYGNSISALNAHHSYSVFSRTKPRVFVYSDHVDLFTSALYRKFPLGGANQYTLTQDSICVLSDSPSS